MIVIGDVHGEYKTLLKLLDVLPQTKEICFVGDLIDRGPQSKEVIELARKNSWQSVIGNHEDLATDPFNSGTWIYNGGWSTIKSYGEISNFIDSEDYEWIENLPLTVVYGDYIISHSFLWDGENTSINDTLWGRSFDIDKCKRVNIFGHTPVKEVKKIHNKHYNIDTGCTFDGKLSAIDLDTEKVYSADKVKD